MNTPMRSRLLLMALVLPLAAACSTERKKTEELPSSCVEVAQLMGKCFHSSTIEEQARSQFPTIKKGDQEALAKLDGDCTRNLEGLKRNCR